MQVFVSGGINSNYSISTDNGFTFNAVGINNFLLDLGTYYKIIAKDSLNCLSDTFEIYVPSPFYSSSVSSNYRGYNVSCLGYSDGSIDVSVYGGLPPYNYSWSSGQNSQDLNNINAGIYSLTITDSNYCIL